MERKILTLAVLAGISIGLVLPACAPRPSAERGREVFERRCAECHFTSHKKKVGPGLRWIMKRADSIDGAAYFLPHGERPTEAGMRSFLVQGHGEMPAQEMPAREVDDLLEYLKGL